MKRNIIDYPLSSDYAFVQAQFILYKIGLCPTRDPTLLQQRKWFNNPVLNFTVLLLYLSLKCISVLSDETNEDLFIVSGNFGHFLGIRINYDILFILITLLAISSQIIYYYNYRNGIKPTFLLIFQMMSGTVAPSAVGLTNWEKTVKMVRQMKLFCRLVSINNQINIPLIAVSITIIVYLSHTSLINTILYGVPNALLFTIYAYYFWNIVLFQIIYIHFICLYFKIKLRRASDALRA